MENTLVEELKTAGYSQRQALQIAGVARSTWHYRQNPRPRVVDPVHQKDRAYPNALTGEEKATIRQWVEACWGAGESVSEGFAAAWDAGVFVGSESSWWRYARSLDQQARPRPPRTGPKTRPPREAPVVWATGPGQVWVWDITDVKGPWAGVTYKLYSVQDMYSRRIVAWRMAKTEKDAIAVEMFTEAFDRWGVPGHVHADNGAAMRSNLLGELCAGRGVAMSFNRPSESNDNPFKESEFRTMKYRPSYPGCFESIEKARAWVGVYVEWFNTGHHHAALGRFTPGQVHDGSWEPLCQARREVLASYHAQHPQRFRDRPRVAVPAPEVGINLHRRVGPDGAGKQKIS